MKIFWVFEAPEERQCIFEMPYGNERGWVVDAVKPNIYWN